MTSADVRRLDRRADLAGDLPRVGADGPAGGALGLAARVGAAVEAPAGGALVDLRVPWVMRLAQPGGVAARLLDLVGERRAVDAAVGHPPARQAGPRAARRAAPAGVGSRASSSSRPRSRSSSSCSSWPARACSIACSSASASDPMSAGCGRRRRPRASGRIRRAARPHRVRRCPRLHRTAAGRARR